jgi:6-phosphogluconolactonase
MYVGSNTALGGEGIYLFKFHAADGRFEPAGLATGTLWQTAHDTPLAGMTRMLAQIRAGWPDMRAIMRGIHRPMALVVHPNQRYLYSVEDYRGGVASAFHIDSVSGKLTILNETPSGGKNPSYVSTDRTGKYLLVSNLEGHTVAVLPIAQDGSLRPSSSTLDQNRAASGKGPVSLPHAIKTSPDNRFAVVADLGLDRLLVYRFDPSRGVLLSQNPPYLTMPPKSGPRHLAFHPNGKFLYVIDEGGSSIETLAWDVQRGVLTPIGTVSTVAPQMRRPGNAADLAVHPGGKFLYATNRADDTIVIFAIAPDGTPRLIDSLPSRGRRPISMSFDPTGHYLFVANVEGGNVSEFRMDQLTGRLSPVGAGRARYPDAIAFAEAHR